MDTQYKKMSKGNYIRNYIGFNNIIFNLVERYNIINNLIRQINSSPDDIFLIIQDLKYEYPQGNLWKFFINEIEDYYIKEDLEIAKKIV